MLINSASLRIPLGHLKHESIPKSEFVQPAF